MPTLKNITLTIAKRTQHAFCYHMNCGDAYLISKVELSRAFKTVLFNEELEDIQLLYKILELTLQVITHPLWIIMDCMRIKSFVAYILGESELYPIFGKVPELFVIPSNSPQDIKWAFYVQKMEDLYFESHSVHIVSNLFHHYYATCLSFLPLFPVLHLHKPFYIVISKASKLSGYKAERIQKLAIREFLKNNDDFVTQGHRQDDNSGLLSETMPRLELLN